MVSMSTDLDWRAMFQPSPNAAIIGLVMLSGSQPCSKLLNDMNMVIGSIIKFEITPAIVQIKYEIYQIPLKDNVIKYRIY